VFDRRADAAAFRRVIMTFGYMEEPNIPAGLGLCRKLGWKFDIMSTSFLVSRRSPALSAKSAMPVWQSRLFIYLSRNAAAASPTTSTFPRGVPWRSVRR
jgi:KUP system potassium uptake protein